MKVKGNTRLSNSRILIILGLLIANISCQSPYRSYYKPITPQLRRIIHKPSGVLTEADFRGIKELNLELYKRTSLEGIELMTDLESLTITIMWHPKDLIPLGKLK